MRLTFATKKSLTLLKFADGGLVKGAPRSDRIILL